MGYRVTPVSMIPYIGNRDMVAVDIDIFGDSPEVVVQCHVQTRETAKEIEPV